MTQALPYTIPRTKTGYFKKSDYVYDKYYDCYLCPAGEILKYATTNKEGYREYKSPKRICKTCSMIGQCTGSQEKQKVVTRHIWQNYLEEVEHQRGTDY